MERQRFEEVAEHLVMTYRNRSESELFSEVDRINKELAPESLRIDVSGPAHGNTLTVLLLSTTLPVEEFHRITKMWIPGIVGARY
jgi:hypothetical protein